MIGAATGATVGGVGATGGSGRMIWMVVDRVKIGLPKPPPSGYAVMETVTFVPSTRSSQS
jgi:hypothetical protein